MVSRRKFIQSGSLTLLGAGVCLKSYPQLFVPDSKKMPVVISTWNHGTAANEAAWEILSKGGHSLDAVEAGVRVPEADSSVMTVGKGGMPDASGKVTLDASIMDEKGRAGSVACLQHIKHPISVARLVMENTSHVMLSGKGALKFALANGFKKERLLSKKHKEEWKKWKKERKQFPQLVDSENSNDTNHDTIGMLALDKDGRISGACTTSGIRYKMHGRVGDSPIIGAGLFVDGTVGGAAATGSGELVMKTLGSFLVVEFMRQGMTPKRACEEAIRRIARKIPDYQNHQVGYIALNTNGEYGAFGIQRDFSYAVKTPDKTDLREAEAWLKTL